MHANLLSSVAYDYTHTWTSNATAPSVALIMCLIFFQLDFRALQCSCWLSLLSMQALQSLQCLFSLFGNVFLNDLATWMIFLCDYST